MVEHLFEGFSSSAETYRKAEEFWESLFQECIYSSTQSNEWQRWWPTTYGDGLTSLEKGDKPIFDAKSDRQKKAITISQIEPESDEVEISAWIRELGYQNVGQYAGVSELVINVAASNEAAQVARKLITKWTIENTDPEEMNQFIKQSIADR